MPNCPYCEHAGFPTDEALRRHQGRVRACRQQCSENILSLISRGSAHDFTLAGALETAVGSQSEGDMSTAMNIDNPEQEAYRNPEHPSMRSGSELDGEVEPMDVDDPVASQPNRYPHVEDTGIFSEDFFKPWIESFPEQKQAGATFGEARHLFEVIHDEQVLCGDEIWGPFENEEEWELAKWLIKNVGHNQTEEFLKLPIVREFIC